MANTLANVAACASWSAPSSLSAQYLAQWSYNRERVTAIESVEDTRRTPRTSDEPFLIMAGRQVNGEVLSARPVCPAFP